MTPELGEEYERTEPGERQPPSQAAMLSALSAIADTAEGIAKIARDIVADAAVSA